jgi:hypothetical protein
MTRSGLTHHPFKRSPQTFRMKEEELIQILNNFHHLSTHSIQDFDRIWSGKTVDYDLLLQYLNTENDDFIATKAIVFGLYFVFYQTRELILVSLDQYRYLFHLHKELHINRHTDAASALGMMLQDKAFGLVPQPLHNTTISYPFECTKDELPDVELDELYENLLQKVIGFQANVTNDLLSK